MTPEETASQYIWEVLKKIKQEIGLVGDGEAIEYELSHVVGAGFPSKDDEMKIIRKLAKDDVVKILEAHEPNWQGPRGWFKLEILQPKFSEVYEKYRKACNLTSYLNDYQEKMLEGENLPEFSQVEHIDNKEKTTPASPIKKHKGQMFPTGSGGGYYNRSHPIRPIKKQSANEIVDGFSSSNYAFVLMVSEGILSASEFGTDGEVNYRLQSAPGQMLMQERQLISKFERLGLLRNLGEDSIFAIATLRDVDIETIRQIATEIKNRQSDLQTKSEEKSGDSKTRYEQLLKEISTPKQTSPKLQERYDKLISEIVSKKPSNYQEDGSSEISGQKPLPDTSSIGKDPVSGIPYCVTESGVGYLKFGKYGKKKKIGRIDTRHFRLLQTLFSPLGVAKTVDSVFEGIRLPKDQADTRLSGWSTGKTRKVELIKFAIKELQKRNKLEGKIKFEFDDTKTQVMAKFSD